MESSIDCHATGLKLKIFELGENIKHCFLPGDNGSRILDEFHNADDEQRKVINEQIGLFHNWSQENLSKMEEEFQIQSQMQKNENARLTHAISGLQAEKVAIHQQLLSLQRRIEELEGDIGHD